MNRLNYNQLYYFYTVANAGSIKAACERLHLTQPTVSAQIKTLEEDLGVLLFERKHRKLVVTPEGHQVYARAEKIFNLGQELLTALESGQVRQDIRIGAVPSVSSRFVQDVTAGLWKSPKVSASMFHASMEQLVEMLNRDQIDMLLSDSPFRPSKRYKSFFLGEDKMVAVGTEKFSSLKRGFPNSLHNTPLMAFHQAGQTQQEIEFYLQALGVRPDIYGRADDDDFIRYVALRGDCVAILPERTIRADLREKRLVRLGAIEQVNTGCWLITNVAGSQSAVIHKLMRDFLAKQRKK